MYDTPEEARQKLESSVVLFNGNPVFIVGTGGKKGLVILKYRGIPLDNNTDVLQENINNPLWDFKSCGTKLGYTLVYNPHQRFWESVYVSRVPTRSSRQGLDDKTVSIINADPMPTFNYTIQNLITKDSKFKDTIKGNFLETKEVYHRVVDQPTVYKSVPMNRKLILMYDRVSPPYLLYRNEKIGYTEDGVRFRLAKHKEFLKEELVDMMGLKVS